MISETFHGVHHPSYLELTTTIVSAFVSNNPLPASELSNMITTVHAMIAGLGGSQRFDTSSLKPAVPIKKSITDEYIVCLEDGKRLKMLKRYLRTHYNLTPEQYRAKWGLPHDYPMVAPNYAELRSEFAKKNGLGKTPKMSKFRRRG